MKYFCVILALLLIGCSSPKAGQLTTIHDEQLVKTLTYLASDQLEGREAGTLGNEKAATYLEDFFKLNQVDPYFSSYRDTLSNFEGTTSNIVGWIPGNDAKLKKEYFIIGAHYDHIGIVKDIAQSDTIANGANDNASGTAVVTELIRYFAKAKSNKRTLVFVFFTAEEKGLLGAYHLAEKLKTAEVPVVAMLNFEMLGVPMKSEFIAYLTGAKLSNMQDKMNQFANTELIGSSKPAFLENLFMQSDNYPFYQKFQIPAHTLSSFDFENYKYYHHVKDEVDQLDLNHLSGFINKIIPVVEQLVNSDSQEIKLN